jgi:hypothetical protein
MLNKRCNGEAQTRAEIRVANGTGGMVQLRDQRFQDNWPVKLQISKENADTWMRYLSAACEQRGWRLSGLPCEGNALPLS